MPTERPDHRDSRKKRDHTWFDELIITFEDGQEERFYIERTQSGSHVPTPRPGDPAEWTQLQFHKCPCCPLSEPTSTCPAAESLEDTILRFDDHSAHENVTTTAIDGARRQTVVQGQLQDVGSLFVQLAAFYSGCPIGKRFKPMLYNLRPFSTNQELSKHMIGRFLLKHHGQVKPSRIEIIEKLEPLHIIFQHLLKRITDKSTGDVVKNSFLQVDAFTLTLSAQIDDVVDEWANELDWESSRSDKTRSGSKNSSSLSDHFDNGSDSVIVKIKHFVSTKFGKK